MNCLMIILNGEETMFVCTCVCEREVGYLIRNIWSWILWSYDYYCYFLLMRFQFQICDLVTDHHDGRFHLVFLTHSRQIPHCAYHRAIITSLFTSRSMIHCCIVTRTASTFQGWYFSHFFSLPTTVWKKCKIRRWHEWYTNIKWL